jgi:biopolymer transport protein ExbB
LPAFRRSCNRGADYVGKPRTEDMKAAWHCWIPLDNDNEKQEMMTMRTDWQRPGLSRIRTIWCGGRLPALALCVAAMVLAAASSASAQAQDAAAPAPQATQPAPVAAPAQAQPAPAAVAPRAAAPNAATPSPQQPATNAAAPQPPGNAGASQPADNTAASQPADNAAGANANAPPAPAPGQPAIGGALLPHQLSLVGMYLDADVVVKAVMIGLAFASFVTWTVFLAKTLELRRARREVRQGLRVLGKVTTLIEAHDALRHGDGPVAQALQAAGEEVRLSARGAGEGLKERIALQLERLEIAAGRKISRGTGVLATIGSTAPFVGLFGTVWGIMNSFIGISNANTTNLAVVAPGIAQALLATAMGLIAAIPAVMIYNVLARQTAHYRALIGDASAQVLRLVSRDLDRARLPLAHAAE